MKKFLLVLLNETTWTGQESGVRQFRHAQLHSPTWDLEYHVTRWVLLGDMFQPIPFVSSRHMANLNTSEVDRTPASSRVVSSRSKRRNGSRSECVVGERAMMQGFSYISYLSNESRSETFTTSLLASDDTRSKRFFATIGVAFLAWDFVGRARQRPDTRGEVVQTRRPKFYDTPT